MVGGHKPWCAKRIMTNPQKRTNFAGRWIGGGDNAKDDVAGYNPDMCPSNLISHCLYEDSWFALIP